MDPIDADKPSGKTGLTTLNRLHCFEVVVEEGGFKRATSRLHITQPALSYQIKHLEDEMGAQLFDRRPGGVTLTDAGRLLLTHAQRVAATVRDAQRAIKDLSEAGEVRVGTVNSIGTYFLPRLLWSVRERCPGTRPLVYREADETIEALLGNHVDLAILANPRADRRLRYEPLFEEHVSLVVGRPHPFFGQREVTREQLARAQFVVLSQQTPTGRLVHRHLERLRIEPEAVVTTENVELAKRMVEIGIGVAFLPDMVTERDCLPDGALQRCHVEPPLVRQIVLVTWNESSESPAVHAFADEVRRQSRNWAARAD